MIRLSYKIQIIWMLLYAFENPSGNNQTGGHWEKHLILKYWIHIWGIAWYIEVDCLQYV